MGHGHFSYTYVSYNNVSIPMLLLNTLKPLLTIIYTYTYSHSHECALESSIPNKVIYIMNGQIFLLAYLFNVGIQLAIKKTHMLAPVEIHTNTYLLAKHF